MGVTIQAEDERMAVMRITGLLKKSEFDALQAEAAKRLGPDASVKLLIIVEDFKGWERGTDWGDLTFFHEYGGKIARIAIVGDPKRETEFTMFCGAGYRAAPVKFFPPDQLSQARQWLAEQDAAQGGSAFQS